jgi:hypothetical protein
MPFSPTGFRVTRYGATIAGAVFLALSSVAAQDVTPVPGRWAVGAELGLNAARGNSSYTMLTSGLRFTHLNKKQFELDWTLGLTYGESNESVIARRMVTTLKGDFHPEATWSPFVFGSLERDRIRRIDLLTNSGAGAKWTYFRNTPGAASISLAALHSLRSIRPSSTTTAIEPRRSTARLSLRSKIVQRLRSGLTVEQTSFWQPAMNTMADHTIEATSRAGYAVSKKGTLFVQHTYRLDSRPPTGVGREDQLLVAGIKLQF